MYVGVAVVSLLLVGAVLIKAEQRGADRQAAQQLKDAVERLETGREGAADAVDDLGSGLSPADIVRRNSNRW
jgi:hypothetical protein